jgi:[ribosomal protein S5]-alanine N-acetyltransferase
MAPSTLFTTRLDLVPMTLPVAEAVLLGQRARTEELLGARLPDAWPGRAMVERAFFASLDLIRSAPDKKLWGNRVMVTREESRRVVGSVVFHGAPGPDGIVEVAYGVEQESQLKGYAKESVPVCVEWALCQPGAVAVRATTPPWHIASRRVLDRCGLVVIGTEASDAFGDLLLYERRRTDAPSLAASSGAIG